MSTIERIPCGNVNCFLISNENNAVLVDTGQKKYRDKIIKKCKDRNIRLIVLTHGHVDHIQNAAYLSTEFNAPIAMHRADRPLVKDNMSEAMFADTFMGKVIQSVITSSMRNETIQPFEPNFFLREGDSLERYGIPAVVVELPGHTKGSIGIVVDGTDIIVGDALMRMMVPSKSLLYGNKEQMEKSTTRIGAYGKVTVHFGHGKSTANRTW